MRKKHRRRTNHLVRAGLHAVIAGQAEHLRPLAVFHHHRHRDRRFRRGKVCDLLLYAVRKEREVWFLQIGNDLAALLVIDDGIDVDDLSGDADLFDILRLAWFEVFWQRFLLAFAGFRLSGTFVLLLVLGGWLTSGLRPPRTNIGAEQQ